MPPCPCGCGAPVPPTHPRAKRPRIYVSHACRVRVYRASPKGRAQEARNLYRRQHTARGRVCQWCGLDDSQVPWSDTRAECAACHKQRFKRRCGVCTGPFRVVARNGRGAGCVRCNREKA